MATLLILLMVLLVGWFWYDSLRARELATRLAKAHCAHHQVQFLDGTVASPRLSVMRSAGRLVWRRDFSFEFLAGDHQRYHGYLSLAGLRLLDLRLDSPLSISDYP